MSEAHALLGQVFGTAYAVGGVVTAGVMVRWAVPVAFTWLRAEWPSGVASVLVHATGGAARMSIALAVGAVLVALWPATALLATQRANRMDALRRAYENEAEEALFAEARERSSGSPRVRDG
jgi:hypothetical protein